MTTSFQDEFSKQSSGYARHRPTYPEALFDWLASASRDVSSAWDCATGNGQAARGLARHFADVVGTDASLAQLSEAAPTTTVHFAAATAEHVPLADGSCDVVTAAQAVHWFDLDRFYDEVRRVLRPGGVIALWSYQHARITHDVDEVIRHYYDVTVSDFWSDAVRTVEAGYASLPFPFDELQPPPMEATATWRMRDALGYLRSWSASQRYVDALGDDPIAKIRGDLEDAWGDPDRLRTATWRLDLRVGRTPDSHGSSG